MSADHDDQATLSPLLCPGSAYFLSASVTFLTFLLSLVAWWRLRGKDISDLGGVQRQASYKDWREDRL